MPSATAELDEEARSAVNGQAQRTGAHPELSRARSFDILVELQDRSAGLAVDGGARAYGSGALPVLPRPELLAAPVSASVAQASALGDGSGAASSGAYRGGLGGHNGASPLESPGEPGLLHSGLAWVRENRATVSAGALALLVLVWGTGVAITQRRRR